MSKDLYPFQLEGVKYLCSGERRFLLDEVGLGKTVQCIKACEQMKLKRVLIVCPAVLRLNWESEFKKWADEQYYKELELTCVSYAYIRNKKNVVALGLAWDVVIIDESQNCVHKNTLILTPTGEKPLSDLKVGDEIISVLGNALCTNRIKAKLVSNSDDSEYRIIKLQNGSILKVLNEHRIQVRNGAWEKAIQIRSGETVRTVSQKIHSKILLGKIQVLWKKMFRNMEVKSTFVQRSCFKTVYILLQSKFSLVQGEEKSCGCSLYDSKQSNAEESYSIKGKRNTERDGAQTKNTRWEWERLYCGPEKDEGVIRNHFQRNTSVGISSKFKGFWKGVSNALQNRLCCIFSKISRGSRWVFSFGPCKETTGQKEREGIKKIRVDSVEIHQFKSDGHTACCIGDFEDLSLEKPPYNYVANGVIVHNCKSWGAVQTKHLVFEIGLKVKRLWLLSATPATKSAADYHPQLSVLEPGKWGKFKDFCEEYCEKKPNRFNPRGFDYVGFRNSNLLRDKLRALGLRRTKKEVSIQLPSRIYSDVEVEILKKVVALSLNIDPDVVVDCIEKGKPIPAELSAVRQAIGLAKIDGLIEWLQGVNKPVVIFAWHREVIKTLEIKLKMKKVGALAITGETSMGERAKIVESFQNGDVDRIILGMGAAGVGINLPRADTCVFLELPWSPALYEQAIGRASRITSVHKTLNIYNFLAVNTVDINVKRVLSAKNKGMEAVLS